MDEAQVPEHLRHLIPYVERWAIACDVTRLDYMEKQGEEAVRQFFHDVEPHRRAVDLWLDNQPEDVGAWPEAAVQFMYLLEAHDGAEPISPVRQAKLEAAHRTRLAERAKQEAFTQSEVAYRAGDFSTVVDLLLPHRESLEGALQARLRIALRKSGRG